jgi:HSP20 family protein
MTHLKFQREVPSTGRNMFPTVNHLFSDIMDGMIPSDYRKWNIPAVNILENDTNFEVKLAAPGMKKQDFKINIEENNLVVSASVTEQSQDKNERFTRKEFSFTSFSRSFDLPENVNIDAIQAQYENGIMNIVIPKQEPTKPKVKEVAIA